MYKEPKPVSDFLIFLCVVMGWDVGILALCPMRERVMLLFEFLLLLLVALISGAAWAAFWAQFLPLFAALVLGGVAFVFIFMLDRAIGGSDWSFAGILRHPAAKYGREFWARMSIRILVAFILSFATSTGATMAMFGGAIQAELEQIVREENNKVADRYAIEINNMLDRHVGAERAEVKSLTQTIAATTPALDEARQQAAAAAVRIQAAKDDEKKELRGANGRPVGPGVKFYGAEDREKAATADLAKWGAQIRIFEPRLNDAVARLRGAQQRLQAAQVPIQADVDRLEAEKKAHFVTPHRDALLSYMALQRVYADPEKGAAANFFGRMMMAVLMTIELSYFAVRIIFAQASIYMVLLVKSTKEDAARADADHEITINTIRNETEKALSEEEPKPPSKDVTVAEDRD